MTNYKNAAGFKDYTPEHDAVMTAYLEPVLNVYANLFDGAYPFSVKVPESFTFIRFESGYDQDNYIHNNRADLIANELGLDFKILQDYPRYSEKNCQDSLRFFFKNENDAWRFVCQVEAMMDCIEENKLSALY